MVFIADRCLVEHINIKQRLTKSQEASTSAKRVFPFSFTWHLSPMTVGKAIEKMDICWSSAARSAKVLAAKFNKVMKTSIQINTSNIAAVAARVVPLINVLTNVIFATDKPNADY